MPVLRHRFVEIIVEDKLDTKSLGLLQNTPSEVVAVDIVEGQTPALYNGRVLVLVAVRQVDAAFSSH